MSDRRALAGFVAALAAACTDDDKRWQGGDADTDTDTDADTDGDGDSDDDSCRLVDVVISVDASSSMVEEHAALRNDVFPAFAANLGEIGQGLDNFRVATLEACPNPANFHTRGASTGECGFTSGEVWIDSSYDNMDAEFACVGDIYLDDMLCSGMDDDEQPVTAMLTALNPPWSENQNAGFLRDDALLVVIAMTDEDEQPTVGDAFTAEEIFSAVAALKGGDPKKVVFLGVGGSATCTGLYGTVDAPATKLKAITDLFSAQERGIWWDLCGGQPMEDGLDAAFAIIDQACDEFVIE